MGNYITAPVIEKQKELALKQRLLDMKQAKKVRDFTQAMQVATVRDRVYWMTAFYITMGAVSVARMAILKEISTLPLRNVPFVLVPFMIGYQIDYAFGTKGNRVYSTAQEILKDESYWFNQPIILPDTLKEAYHQLQEETNEKLRKLNKPEEKPWAK